MAGATGLEPATSGVTGRRSNQLSYAPFIGRPSPTSEGATLISPRKPCQAWPSKPVSRAQRQHSWALIDDLAWWAMRDLNPRPPRCKRDALPAELIALGGRTRSPIRAVRSPSTRSIQRVAQSLSRFELGLFRSGNLYFFTGARIASFRRRASGHRKSAKADQPYFVAAFECFRNRVEDGIDSPTCFRLSQL